MSLLTDIEVIMSHKSLLSKVTSLYDNNNSIAQPTYQLNSDLNITHLNDAFIGRLSKVEALLNVANHDSFLEAMEKDIYNYLWTLNGLVLEMKQIYECLAKQLIK